MKLIILLLITLPVYAGVDDYECLVESFTTTVEHKGQPFGLLKNILKVNKLGCVVTINHEKLKYLKSHWIVDVCREPVHIKQGTGALEILKKDGACEGSGSEYCKSLKKILAVIQDDGLIFADGEKENIKSDHGRIFCSFLLLKKYLKEGVVFNKQNNSLKLLIDIKKPYIKQDQVDKAPRVDAPKVLKKVIPAPDEVKVIDPKLPRGF